MPIKKQLDNGKTITYKTKFIDSYRFMSSSLSDLVDNLSDIKCKISANILDLETTICYYNVLIVMHGLKKIVKN